jgi:hypothetical protein
MDPHTAEMHPPHHEVQIDDHSILPVYNDDRKDDRSSSFNENMEKAPEGPSQTEDEKNMFDEEPAPGFFDRYRMWIRSVQSHVL